MLDSVIHLLMTYLDIIPMIISGIIMLFVCYEFSKLTSYIVRFLLPKTMALELLIFIPRATQIIALIMGCAVTLHVVGINASNLTTVFGLSTIAIGMSFKDLFTNLIQGMMIIVNRTFSIGDEISVKDASGIVVKIDLMHTQLDCGGEKVYS